MKDQNCPQCNSEMTKYSKKMFFFLMLVTSFFIWPMFLFVPFMGLMPRMYKCKPCKKFYKEKELQKIQQENING